MSLSLSRPSSAPVSSRRVGRLAAMFALSTLLIGSVGCNPEEAQRTFRQQSLSQIETGVGSILDGVLSGLFAVANEGTDQPADAVSTDP